MLQLQLLLLLMLLVQRGRQYPPRVADTLNRVATSTDQPVLWTLKIQWLPPSLPRIWGLGASIS